MIVRKLQIKNFRNYESATITPAEGMNVLYGKNAQGKTNLLEAIYLFAMAKSFRAAKDNELLRFGQESAEIKADFYTFGRELSGEILLSATKRKYIRVGGVPLSKTSELLGQFPIVAFSPDELQLISGAPEIRRRFCDSAISAGKPAYYSALHEYHRICKQKNALLKNAPRPEELLVWNTGLAEKGALLMQYRREFFEKIAPICKTFHREIAPGETLFVKYAPSVPVKPDKTAQAEAILEVLTKRAEAEIQMGISMTGPHRDEVQFFINDRPARDYASQGQQRTAAVVLKVAQATLAKHETGEEPLLLLDDVFGELDSDRRAFLAENMAGRQTIMTGTEKNDALKADRYFKVEDGKVCIST